MTLNEFFKKFRETGKIADYLKYREELAKELKLKETKHENNKDQRDCHKKS